MLPILITSWLVGWDPSVAPPADAIPGQVPAAIVIETEPVGGRVLRGDYEPPDRVLLVFTPMWAASTREIAEQVLASGAAVSIVLEVDNASRPMTALVDALARRHPDRISEFAGEVDTPWARDWGPIQVREHDWTLPPAGRSLWLDADYDDLERQQDNQTPVRLGQAFGTTVAELPWRLDGGAFISNGAGLCVLTREYLDEQGIVWDQADLARMLEQIGCRATAIVPTLIGEQTKHADMIAQFVTPDRLMMAELIDELGGHSEDALRLRAAELGIRRAAAKLGLALEIVHVPTPPTAEGSNPRTYVNGLRLADRYLMPTYPELGASWDRAARAAVESAQEVEVVPIRTTTMIGSGGAIHCAALGLFL